MWPNQGLERATLYKIHFIAKKAESTLEYLQMMEVFFAAFDRYVDHATTCSN